jgi:hypothetical protein
VLVLLASLVLCLAIGGGSALAQSPAVQAAGQAAETSQSANANSTAQQTNPTNSAVSIRIGSPGNSGSVDQSNRNGSQAEAGNAARTSQGVAQGGGSGGGVQNADQDADTSQSANANSSGVQVNPSNGAISIRIHSPGTDGPVSQSNDNASRSRAGNEAATGQTAIQGGGGGGGGVQNAKQDSDTSQSANANSTATQTNPTNSVNRIRIHSAGDDGAVKQSNANGSSAEAGNRAATEQVAGQGGGSGGAGVQNAGQDADTSQSANANSTATQTNPTNEVNDIRLNSPGNGGDITQSNTNASAARAGNRAATGQTVLQGGGSGGGVQSSDQDADTDQSANANSTATQCCATNSAGGVAINSPGNGGSITQSNENGSSADSGNQAATEQNTMQGGGATKVSAPASCSSCAATERAPAAVRCPSCGQQVSPTAVSSPGVQAAGQESETSQSANSNSNATQTNPTNSASPVRVNSPGNEGSVTQDNSNGSESNAGNEAGTVQTLAQVLQGLFTGTLVQAAGQDADTDQSANGNSDASQLAPCNTTSPVSLGSEGNGGSVRQTNANGSMSRAGNLARTLQLLAQLV